MAAKNNINLEIERKFLVGSLPDELDRETGIRICQGYISFDGSIEVRVRSYGDKFFQTVKDGSGLVRKEYEFELNEAQFRALWDFTTGKRLEKTRYLFPYGENVIEFDVYEGKLRSLIVAEVEFVSEEASARFESPPFLAEEITSDPRYANRKLAIHGLDPGYRESTPVNHDREE